MANRYIYVPLGGSARPLLSTLVVFTFVALWHDLTMRLLVWGWLVTAVVVPELVAKKWVSEKTVRHPSLSARPSRIKFHAQHH